MLDHRSHLMSDHSRDSRLTEPWRTIEEDMLERRPAYLRTIDRDLKMLFHSFLSDIFPEGLRAERYLRYDLFIDLFWLHDTGDVGLRGLDRHRQRIQRNQEKAKEDMATKIIKYEESQ